jgi:Tol biopolymer transport system component
VSVSSRLPRLVAGLAVATLLFALLPASVGATTPGQNGLIAFRILDTEQNTSAIFTIQPDGSHETQITFPTTSGDIDTLGNWSPDGTKLVLDRHMDCGPDCGTDELYVVNADGSNPHKIATPEPSIESPAWSPDGQRIAFAMATGGVVNDLAVDVSIWEIGIDGSGLRQVTHPIGFQQSDVKRLVCSTLSRPPTMTAAARSNQATLAGVMKPLYYPEM